MQPSLCCAVATSLCITSLCVTPHGFVHAEQPEPPPRVHVTQPSTAAPLAQVDWGPWTELLGKYRQSAGVDFAAWANNAQDRRLLSRMLTEVGRQKLGLLNSDSAKKAFWINTYNALAVEMRLRQLSDQGELPENIWKQALLWVDGHYYSLDAIEHEQLRPLNDPRIHFALNCGARSCPPLKSSAWSAAGIEQDLQAATEQFLRSEQAVSWDGQQNRVNVSKLFEWYAEDFGADDAARLKWIGSYLDPRVAERISETGEIGFQEFDWSLAQAEVQAPTYDATFPPMLEHWRRQPDYLRQGLIEANRLRRRLLDGSSRDGSRVYLERVEEAVSQLQRHVAEREPGAVSIAGFNVTADRLEAQLGGRMELRPEKVFAAFDGRWFGLWDTMPVNHDWKPSELFDPPRRLVPKQPRLVALQYAWIGNGFGWNCLVSLDEDRTELCVLGQVYYADPPEYDRIRGAKPHVGFADVAEGKPAARLVWITEQEIFLEEAFSPSGSRYEEYVITGLRHRLFDPMPQISAEAVQARYSRDPQNRPAFRQIDWEPDITSLR